MGEDVFEKIDNKVQFSLQEENILDFWNRHDIFQKSLKNREDAPYFSFYDGPPFATGVPHYGHLLSSTIKDIIPRYQTMKGKYVPRRFGWDCHGLPVEMLIQEELNLRTGKDILEFGEDQFNEACRVSVLKYNDIWKKVISRLGRWVDFENGYKTMDKSFMESTWWVFNELFKKGFIYKGYKVLPYSWKAETSLSNFEANSNYKNIQDPVVTVKFPLIEEKDTYFLAWTTTPWTLVSNLALCVHEAIEYIKVYDQQKEEYYYLSKTTFKTVIKDQSDIKIIETLSGKQLTGKRYTPIFDTMKKVVDTQNAYQVFSDDYVTEDSGTGIVHLAPYGEEDFKVLKKNKVPIADIVNNSGQFKESVDLFFGKNIKEADKDIITYLKEEKKLFHQDTIQHNYPFCWRTDTPLIYKPVLTWFVSVEKIKDQLVKNNEAIEWVPSHIKHGRFGLWLQNARDWDIGRNRFWGTPIPIWESEEGDLICIGSIEELEKLTESEVEDIHKHYIDHLTIERGGKIYRRVSQVLDCWFESGAMPYSQNHYPFENKESVDQNFPADFIAEGLDQTRGWFYTLLILSTILKGREPFKNAIVNGLILAEDGKKMSKRLQNYPDTKYVMDEYGSDALRLYMIQSAVVKGEYLKFSENGVKDVLKSILIPLWNSLSFFVTYANIDHWNVEKDYYPYEKLENSLDIWIVSYTEQLIEEVSSAMDHYNLQKSIPPILAFIDSLTNWYIRRSRRRFWKSEGDQDKMQAYSTLYSTLLTLSKVLAPFIPFLSERIYQILTFGREKESVHLEDYPISNKERRKIELEMGMKTIQNIVEQGRSIRSREKIKIRKPLQDITLISKDQSKVDFYLKNKEIILEELNIKEAKVTEDSQQFLEISCNPNLPILGKRLGAKMKEVSQKIRKFTTKEIEEVDTQGHIKITLSSGDLLEISKEELLIVRKAKGDYAVSSDGDLSIVLNTDITEELEIEGIARDMVNLIQKKRKEMDLNYEDRINIFIYPNKILKEVIGYHQNYILKEVLGEHLKYLDSQEKCDSEKIENIEFLFRIEKCQ